MPEKQIFLCFYNTNVDTGYFLDQFLSAQSDNG